jgi:hypothetical protein
MIGVRQKLQYMQATRCFFKSADSLIVLLREQLAGSRGSTSDHLHGFGDLFTSSL